MAKILRCFEQEGARGGGQKGRAGERDIESARARVRERSFLTNTAEKERKGEIVGERNRTKDRDREGEKTTD